MKKYLKTIEEIEALRNTDTKIYERGFEQSYWKFVNGVLCKFFTDTNEVFYNVSFIFNNNSACYIEVPDKSDESWVGKLGWVSDESKDKKTRCGVLVEYLEGHPHPYKIQGGLSWKYFTPLTPEEVEKYTGYKFVKEI